MHVVDPWSADLPLYQALHRRVPPTFCQIEQGVVEGVYYDTLIG